MANRQYYLCVQIMCLKTRGLTSHCDIRIEAIINAETLTDN